MVLYLRVVDLDSQICLQYTVVLYGKDQPLRLYMKNPVVNSPANPRNTYPSAPILSIDAMKLCENFIGLSSNP